MSVSRMSGGVCRENRHCGWARAYSAIFILRFMRESLYHFFMTRGGQMASELDAIVLDATSALRPLLERAFEAGRAVGRREATTELRARLSDAIGPIMSQNEILELARQGDGAGVSVFDSMPTNQASSRAAPGTVRPAILALVQSHPQGIRREDIERLSGVKGNSVRGTLYNLQKDGFVMRRGRHWLAAPQKNEPVDVKSAADPSTGSDRNPAQGREAGPGGGT